MFSKTETAVLEYLYKMSEIGLLPATKASANVSYIWRSRSGTEIGITAPMAQTIQIISERCGENGEGGILYRASTPSEYTIV